MPKELTGKETAKVVDIIDDHFNRGEFEALLFTELEVKLDDYVAGGTWREQVFELLDAAVRKSFIIKLLDALAEQDGVAAESQQWLKDLAVSVAARPEVAAPKEDRAPLTFRGNGMPPPGPAGEAKAEPPPVGPTGPLGTIQAWLGRNSHRILLAGIVAYALLLTINTSITVPIGVVRQVDQQTQERNVAIQRVAGADSAKPQYGPPPPGYSIYFDSYPYGLNPSGEAKIGISPLRYLKLVLIDREIQVDVLYPNNSGMRPFPVRYSGSGRGQIALDKVNDPAPSDEMGSLLDWQQGGSRIAGTATATAAESWAFVASAHAASPLGGRLYLQSVIPGKGADLSAVDATLRLVGGDVPLNGLSTDLSSTQPSQLPIVPDAVTVQNYQLFFPLPRLSLGRQGSISLQSSRGFLQSGYSESFALPAELPLGKPVELSGDAGGKLVVQLAYPIDVVFFERQGTSPVTDLLAPKIGEAGLAVRRNARLATSPGDYNVVYAGKDVPASALQSVVRILIDNGIDLRSIQPGLQLKNGLQNQVQIGSNKQLACLPALTPPQRSQLLGPEAQFSALANALPTTCP